MSRQLDPRDPVLDPRRVLELARRHLPSAQSVTGVDESGGEARAYAIDDGFIFKTQRPHRVRPRTSLEKEVFHLQQLARDIPDARVPRVLGYGREPDVEYILMTRMPGVAMRNVNLQGAARQMVVRELGALLATMHRLPLQPLRESGLFPGDTDSTGVMRRLQANLRLAIDGAKAARDEWTLDRSPEDIAGSVSDSALLVDEAPVALHSNPGTEHVFVDPDKRRLTGVIDFGDAYISHPALDMRRWSRHEDRTALIAGYAAETPVGAGFHSTWQLISVTALMLDFVERPARRKQALEDLKLLLSEA